MPETWNPQNLPVDDNITPFAFCLDVRGDMVVRHGKMIAYYGDLKFESLARSGLSGMIMEAVNSPNLLHEFIKVTGHGKLILGDNHHFIASYTAEKATFTMRAPNLLAFHTSLRCQASMIDGYLNLIGTGKLLASSSGPPVFLEPPCRCDPDAVLGWADMPSPSWRYDHNYVKTALGAVGSLAGITASGEEKQLDFNGSGTVILQSVER
jgi:uncharacterized protein (AIM24 family)